jgi:glyoxylase-like metal-dependent hydrolase (beta-lactamase superfamily II)
MSDHALETYVDTRPFGDARVSLINDGSGLSVMVRQLTVPEPEWRRAVPEVNARGEFVVNYQAALIQIGSKNLLVDLGFDDPSPASQWKEPRHHRSPGIEQGVRALGVEPEQVDYVLITHAHGDHIAGATTTRDGQKVLRFPKARHLIGRGDWEGNPRRGGSDSTHAANFAIAEQAGLLEMVDGQREVVPGVTMIHAPGESPGHCIVRVRSGGESFYFVGDLFHHPCEVRNLDWVSSGRDAKVMRASREKLLAEAVPAGATIVWTHSLFPGWGKIVREADRYRWISG